MADSTHLAILNQGVETWNKWRAQNQKIRPDLSGADLSGRDLRKADLVGADLSKARLNGEDTILDGAELFRANLKEAYMTGAKLRGATLDEADLTGANLYYTDLSGASLTYAIGVRVDSTRIRDTRFSPDASDLWSILRRKYTGPNLLFHLMLLVIFFIPYVAKTMALVGVNATQERILSIKEEIISEARIYVARYPGSEGLSRAVAKLSSLQPCLAVNCQELPAWKVLFGFNRGGYYWILVVLLLFYNVCRMLLTWTVGPLREQEERSGYTPEFKEPRWKGWPFWSGWKFWRLWKFWRGYGWLSWPHKVVSVLMWLAIGTFLFHAYDWLTRTLWLAS